MHAPINRRQLLSTSGLSLGALAFGRAAEAAFVVGGDDFAYEVTRSEAEWRARLGEHAFAIMRRGETEVPKSSPLWLETGAGAYLCRGCELHLYASEWKVIVDLGWVFFRHSEANAVMTGIDWPEGIEQSDALRPVAQIEAHCRRCGSHLGHIVFAQGKLLHCINGAALNFVAAEA